MKCPTCGWILFGTTERYCGNRNCPDGCETRTARNVSDDEMFNRMARIDFLDRAKWGK